MNIQPVKMAKDAAGYTVDSFKNIKRNFNAVKTFKNAENYKNARLDANMDNLLDNFKPGSKQMRKAIKNIAEKATKDFGVYKKQLAVAGGAIAVVAGVTAAIIKHVTGKKDDKATSKLIQNSELHSTSV